MANTQKKTITELAFARLGEEKLLHQYCSILYKTLGLVVDFISAEDDTLRLSKGVNFNNFCTLIRNTASGAEACHNCDVIHALRGAKRKEPICYRCHAGLHEVVVPLFDSRGMYLGCLTSGQFHLQEEQKMTAAEIQQLSQNHGLPGPELQSAYNNSQVLTRTQLEGVISYLEIIGKHLTGLRETLLFLEKVNTPGKIESIRCYVEKNYTQKLTVQEVARKFYVSSSFLSHNFKKELNVSFTDYLNAYRVNKAKELLTNTRLAISEIALMTGFGSISQFNRCFLAKSGTTANQYRKNHIGD